MYNGFNFRSDRIMDFGVSTVNVGEIFEDREDAEAYAYFVAAFYGDRCTRSRMYWDTKRRVYLVEYTVEGVE